VKIATPDQIDLVIAHGRCFDGYTAAWCAWLRHGDRAEYHHVLHGDPPVDVAGRHVAILDFAYKRPVLERMASEAASIVVLDHHATARDDLEGLPFAVFDMEKSGARLAYEWFVADYIGLVGRFRYVIERLVDYVQDRDLWTWNLYRAREITEAMKILPFEFERWTAFAEDLNNRFEFVAEQGKTLLALTEQHLTLLEATASYAVLDGHPCRVANAPYIYASELGHRLATRVQGGSETHVLGADGLGVAWRYDHSRGLLSFSLRSTPESHIDVAKIAATHGGGGHRNAAGFEIFGSDPWAVLWRPDPGDATAFFPCVVCGEPIPAGDRMVFGKHGAHKHTGCEGLPAREVP
jgi:oligoribonuclease NrnB/cAMP/cGMP phosphodiesterase (DHH superfamily)